ncbi:hypothetical protein A2V68_00620 [candidate division Kazan bacterium RBG_13_50_9]|uniref:Uncharacterized protein n=1 Tax=candidate division Kazan bacterium RBG_13_50_9 TaxID=1798535 RepID=A0A1F4NSB1_UNCK3|nr:MAG: hypothetical protein A2V68_00620 [candidate division Kazan bacterium RBG_13_50_9]
MRTDRLIDHQIKIEVTNSEGVIRFRLPDGQEIVWPIRDEAVAAGTFYLTLSPTPQLPTKDELAKQILKEILQGGE